MQRRRHRPPDARALSLLLDPAAESRHVAVGRRRGDRSGRSGAPWRRYDLPEEGIDQLYQDFGHSHWHNSLIWGDDVREVAILGPGGIDGAGLTRDGPGARWKRQAGERPLSMRAMTQAQIDDLEPTAAAMAGKGNKAIAFKNGRDIRLSGFTIRKGGHFAILATGTQKLRIDGLTIDTDRDGIDLDCVRDVVVERCRVNSPNDDAIVIKSSHALGRAIAAEDILIRDCDVSGYDMGSLIDGTRTTRQQIAPIRIASRAGSNWGPRAMAVIAISVSRIAASPAAGGWHWRRWMAG